MRLDLIYIYIYIIYIYIYVIIEYNPKLTNTCFWELGIKDDKRV